MNDREKVIKGLTAHMNGDCNKKYCPWFECENDGCIKSMFDAALKLLKEQEPTRPVFNGRYWECEKCGEKYKDILAAKEYKYCPHCGRRIEWAETRPAEE